MRIPGVFTMPIKDVIKNFYQIESTNDPNGYPYLDLKLNKSESNEDIQNFCI